MEPRIIHVIHVGRFALPVHNLPSSIAQLAQFGTDDAAPVALAFFANLFLAAAFSFGMNQLDAKAVTHTKEGRAS